MPRDREWDNLRSRVSKFLKIRFSGAIDDIVALFKQFYKKFCVSYDWSEKNNYKVKITEYAIVRIFGPLKMKTHQQNLVTQIYIEIISYCRSNGIEVELSLKDIFCKYNSNQKRGFATSRTGYTRQKRKENKQVYNFKSNTKKTRNTFPGPSHRRKFTVQLYSQDPRSYEILFNNLKKSSYLPYYQNKSE
jgi:hypothetical protein